MSDRSTIFDLMAVMKALYASEINCGLSSFWDGGFTLWVGDDMNGRRAEEQLYPESLPTAGYLLWTMAMAHYPNSDFAVQQHAVLRFPTKNPS